MGVAVVSGTVPGVDRFDEIMAAEPGLSRHFALMGRVWDDTSRGVEAIVGLCAARRLVTRCTVEFSSGPATVTLHCGPVSLECLAVPALVAAEVARVAAGTGVNLRLGGFGPACDGWALAVTAHCDTPFPFAKIEVPTRSVRVERQQAH